jgi:hypothetical protein
MNHRISSLRSLCFADQFLDESVLQRISSMTSCASANQFAYEVVRCIESVP